MSHVCEHELTSVPVSSFKQTADFVQSRLYDKCSLPAVTAFITQQGTFNDDSSAAFLSTAFTTQTINLSKIRKAHFPR